MTGVCNNDTDGADVTFTIDANGDAVLDLRATGSGGLCEVDSTYEGSHNTYTGAWGMWGNTLGGAWSTQ